MSTAASIDMRSTRQVSPELALVDSLLAERERTCLPDPPDVFGERLLADTSVTSADTSPPDRGLAEPPGSSVAEKRTLTAAPDSDPTGSHPSTLARPSPFPFSFPDNGQFVGVRVPAPRAHGGELGFDSPVREALVTSAGHLRRVSTLVPTSSAAVAVALFVAQLYLSHGALT